MDEYNKQANDFLNKHNVKLTIKKSELQVPAPWSTPLRGSGYKYDITLTTIRGTYHFPFWDSIANRLANKQPTSYDVLACLDIYEGTIDEFADDFGYNDELTSVTIEAYNSVVDQTLQLKHIFPAQALEDLMEIN